MRKVGAEDLTTRITFARFTKREGGLASTHVAGNVPCLRSCCSRPRFLRGLVEANFLAQTLDLGLANRKYIPKTLSLAESRKNPIVDVQLESREAGLHCVDTGEGIINA